MPRKRDGEWTVIESDRGAVERCEPYRSALVKMGVESWRFIRLFTRVLQKLETADQQRYHSQLRFHLSALENTLAGAGLRLVNLEGQIFDPGMAVTVANPSDFQPDDAPLVEQMLEPVIVDDGGLVRTGKVMLGRGSKCEITSA